jgi:hypothetical protein
MICECSELTWEPEHYHLPHHPLCKRVGGAEPVETDVTNQIYGADEFYPSHDHLRRALSSKDRIIEERRARCDNYLMVGLRFFMRLSMNDCGGANYSIIHEILKEEKPIQVKELIAEWSSRYSLRFTNVILECGCEMIGVIGDFPISGPNSGHQVFAFSKFCTKE